MWLKAIENVESESKVNFFAGFECCYFRFSFDGTVSFAMVYRQVEMKTKKTRGKTQRNINHHLNNKLTLISNN